MEGVRIIPFDPAYAADFARLNYQWINEHFTVEDKDRQILDHPSSSIIDIGGHIFFALSGDHVVGTVALIPDGEAAYELAKMAVLPEFRGLGIGDMLIEACITHSRDEGKKTIYLLSNTELEAALNLYKKHGFSEKHQAARSPYERVNIVMELALRPENR